MKNKRTKIIVGVLLIAVGVPVTLITAALAWFAIADKTNGTIVSSGITRRYLLYVPKTYDRSKSTPLIISMHGGGSWPAAEMRVSGWNELAEQHGFIVVYPAGRGIFLGGFAPGPRDWHMGPSSPGQDVTFISDLIAKLEAEYNIDSNRIYAVGMSNGGGMAFALSCRLPNRIAAVGAVAGAQTFVPVDRCRDSRPVATVAFHGTADPVAPYKGGPSPFSPGPLPNIKDWTTQVARRNQCKGDPRDTRISASVNRLAYANCAENADVILYTVEGGGHTWPGGGALPEWLLGPTNHEVNATSLIWEFCLEHRRIRQ